MELNYNNLTETQKIFISHLAPPYDARPIENCGRGGVRTARALCDLRWIEPEDGPPAFDTLIKTDYVRLTVAGRAAYEAYERARRDVLADERKHMFKVGQRVRATVEIEGDMSTVRVGTEGVITKVYTLEEEDYDVMFEPRRLFVVSVDEIEAVAPDIWTDERIPDRVLMAKAAREQAAIDDEPDFDPPADDPAPIGIFVPAETRTPSRFHPTYAPVTPDELAAEAAPLAAELAGLPVVRDEDGASEPDAPYDPRLTVIQETRGVEGGKWDESFAAMQPPSEPSAAGDEITSLWSGIDSGKFYPGSINWEKVARAQRAERDRLAGENAELRAELAHIRWERNEARGALKGFMDANVTDILELAQHYAPGELGESQQLMATQIEAYKAARATGQTKGE